METIEKRDALIAQSHELREQIVSLRIAVDKLNDELLWLAENEKIQRQIDSLTKEYDSHQKSLCLFEEAYQKTDRTLVNKRVMYEEWQRDSQQYTQACQGSTFLELVIKTTERDGLPLFMLKRKLPLIEDDVNALLSPFLDKKLVLCVDEKDVIVGVETSVSTKKKNVISNYLGGMESFVIDLSLKLGFSKFANLPRSNFFIIDEGISVMDQERLSNISHMFDFLSNITDHVLLISHIPSIKDFVHRSIDIMKDETTQKSRLLIT
jgi:DNA repair exonuclease SbcCD ATPase subunit